MTMQTPDQARPASRRRGPYAKTAAVRQAILDAALEVFAESGYRSGSIREVAQLTGMSEAGVLHHFPTKSALLAGVLDRRDDQASDLVPLDHSRALEVLRGITKLAARNQTTPEIIKMFSVLAAEATAPEHPAHEYFTTRYAQIRTRLEKTFENLAEQERLRPEVTPAQAAVATIAIMDGLQVQWLLTPGGVDMAAEMTAHFQRLTDLTTEELSGSP